MRRQMNHGCQNLTISLGTFGFILQDREVCRLRRHVIGFDAEVSGSYERA